MNEKVYWKIIPWGAKLGSDQTMILIDHLTNEGFQVEIEYFEDKDNGRIPILHIWGGYMEEKANV